MIPNPTSQFEEEPIKYIKGDDNLWHWFELCPEYPAGENREEYESHALIPSGELCRHCLLIELKASLQSLTMEAI
ncbi:MAG: hypothetical protein EHM58_06475 [Ignavibacteriae bacterium]|nr:MAG: hypothetical protein EHM58_06475 [Ignavibacteriota bacterium]